jgi:hypothetical protein
MVAVPLGVVMGLNEPQEPAGVQLQVTPAFFESPVTVAVTGTAGPPGTNIPGGAWLMLTSIAFWFEPPQPDR